MTEENDGTINLFAELGISDERAHEINTEIHAIRDNSEYLTEILSSIPETYDRESIILGVFLAEIILRGSGRLLPSNMNGAVMTIPPHTREVLDEFLSDLLSKMEEDEPAENSTEWDPTQN